MIEYVEVRRKSDREIIGLIDNAKSIIWHSTYYGVGDFEIYAVASTKHIQLLREGNWITRPNDIEVGIIEKVSSTYTIEEGTMIVASGRFAKSILDRRHIYRLSSHQNRATILSGKVESAVRALVANNAISCSFDNKRNIPFLELGALSNIPTIIVDEFGQAADKQVSYDNLLEYTEEVLKEYKIGAIITLDDSTNKLQYSCYIGADRSIENAEGNEPVIFSQEYDNLTDSEYSFDDSTKKTAALIGGEGEGLERFYSLVAGTETGFERRETWVDASSVSRTYKEEGSDVEKTYTVAQYTKLLNTLAKQELANATETQSFEATVNVNGGVWRLNDDYALGDIVTFQDNKLGKYANVRITEITEVQDENGYSIEPVFDFETGDVELMQVLTSENGSLLMTESGVALQPERTLMTAAPSSNSNTDIVGVKISELPESTDVYDGCCMPIVTNGETKKIYFSMLKEKIEEDIDVQAITNAQIDEICV